MNSKGELQELCQKRGCVQLPVYNSVSSDGPSHSPLFVRQVTVVWEDTTITKRGEGRSKKEADKMAAQEMLQRLKADTCEDVYSGPVTSPTRFKGMLGEVLQGHHHSPPQYTVLSERGPPHRKEFTVTCTIILRQEQVERVGEGSTKKIAESNAAKNMLTFLQDNDTGPLLPTLPPFISPQSGGPPTLSDDGPTKVSGGGGPAQVGGQSDPHVLTGCQYEHLTGENGMFLCLALNNQLAAHGMSSESQEQAQTEAMNNLAHSLSMVS